MDWFERTMGFRERTPEQVRDHLELHGRVIRSTVNDRQVGCGWLEVPRLDALRTLDRDLPDLGVSTVGEVVGDVAALHRDPAHAGALFQAASQFNLLEMLGPDVTPERGVGIYDGDPTQGPACAIACGGGTIYRNYFAPVDGGLGQTHDRQIDTLADLQAELGPGLWQMRNGYALCTQDGLHSINARLAQADDAERDRLRGLLRIGVQHQVAVLDTSHVVTQVYGSALPVAYGGPPAPLWEPFARLILEASYEATLRIARIWQAEPVFLTLLGGGVFGNDDAWIEDSIVQAVQRIGGLDVRLVSFRRSHPVAQRIVQRCASDASRPTTRTSRTHPIRLDTVSAPGGPPIGMTLAPGKVQPHAATGAWRRSLEADLDRLRHHYGIDHLVCLVQDHELERLGIQALAERANAHGITLHRLPVPDGDVPSVHALSALLDDVAARRAQGRRVAFHCMGGLGRAGTAACCALIHAGVPAGEALDRVREARPGAVENLEQEAFVLSWSR